MNRGLTPHIQDVARGDLQRQDILVLPWMLSRQGDKRERWGK